MLLMEYDEENSLFAGSCTDTHAHVYFWKTIVACGKLHLFAFKKQWKYKLNIKLFSNITNKLNKYYTNGLIRLPCLERKYK